VGGPNTEGFANIAAGLCANFSPAMDKDAGPLLPARPLGDGQVSMISQSGGLGFAFFDRARPRNFRFRYIVTTGNEAVLESADFIDYMLDEGETDVFLLLVEAVKTPEKFKRVAEKALKAGKPLIVRKIGQSAPGSRAVASHTAALRRLAGRLPRHVRALRVDRRRRFRGDARSRLRLPRLRRPHAGGQSRRHLHLVRGRGCLDGGCLRRGGA
jgi:Acyl-CoA synthetase (NDP forming)